MSWWPFGKKKSEEEAVAEFWAWWAEAKDRVAAGIEAGNVASFAEDISTRVSAIQRNLAWELGPGKKSKHSLCITSEGKAALRISAARWLANAPQPDATWEYYDSRQPSPSGGLTLNLGEVSVALDDFTIAMQRDESREVFDLRLFHPAFGRLPLDQRQMAAFLFLDNTLGEDRVEKWVGAIEIGDGPLAGAVDPRALVEAVAALGESATGEQLAVLQADTPQGPLLVLVNRALKRLDHLFLDHYFEVRIAVDRPERTGLPSAAELEVIDKMEAELLETLGRDAVFIAHETGAAKRVIHLHAAATGPVPARLDEWRARHAHRTIFWTQKADPEWMILRQW